ncbi:MAG: ABC transporter ATP-binding protein [Clostridium sp.]|uniref:ABC transporter ATP-binding protein n=1 Tax=Clostridium sp. TaxID=1506 RepID=UPI002A901797|nr:ABC transporter ATP-binding protein [Clostridium sp.]MDY5096663.1 ABC transporter ATP-binding protein [Clostridium sp.]
MQALRVNNLSRDFGGVRALSNVNMDIEHGDIVGLIGPNGAGKTTLFNLLTGIYNPSEGEVFYKFNKETSIKNMKPFDIAKLGVSRTFQNIRLFGEMTVAENVKIGIHKNIKYNVFSSIFRLPSYYKQEKAACNTVNELLDVFGLLDKKDELAKNLPYGEQRRLEIARALASKPKFILLDEPAAGMNPNETNELRELIKWIKAKFDITIILIEHDMSLVMSVCDNIYVLDHGEMIASGTPKEIKNNPVVIKAYLGGED